MHVHTFVRARLSLSAPHQCSRTYPRSLMRVCAACMHPPNPYELFSLCFSFLKRPASRYWSAGPARTHRFFTYPKLALIVSRRSLHIHTYRAVFLGLAVQALATGLPCSPSRVSSPQQCVVPTGSRDRKKGTNSWLGWTNQQLPRVYPCSLQDVVLARARRGEHLRSMPCLQECVRGFPLQTELILSKFPIPTCHIISNNKSCFVRYCVRGGALLRLRTKLPFTAS